MIAIYLSPIYLLLNLYICLLYTSVSEVLHSRNYNPDVRKLVKGVMIESYLLEGRQDISDHMTPGCSITDPCLGWEDTERLLYDIAEKC